MAQICDRFALRSAVFKIQDCWKRKFRKWTEWPQSDFEILTVRRTSYPLRNYPRGVIWVCFAVRQPFSRYKVVGNRKNRDALNDLRLTLNSKTYPVYTKKKVVSWKVSQKCFVFCNKTVGLFYKCSKLRQKWLETTTKLVRYDKSVKWDQSDRNKV